jgi:hypothetical protein
MFSAKDKRKLRALQQDGYLSSDNPLSKGVLRAVHAADSDPRPEWLDAFLTMDTDGDGTESERLHHIIPEEDTTTMPLYEMLGRKDPERREATKRILACWLRRGLGARVKDIAAEVDADTSAVSRVRTNWEWELRALLQDALCLNISGEDLYMAVTTPHYEPTRLLQRLAELRAARTNNDAPGPLASQYEQELREAWFDYKIKEGLKGRSPDSYAVNPPRWFVSALTEV